MARWDCGFNNNDDVLNLNLFARKSFGFQGIPKEKEDILKKIVTQIGASCIDHPKYIFTNAEYYNSLSDVSATLYNVTYIRDCVDANRCLSIEQYKFGPKYSETKEYQEFDPCCANFHDKNGACLVCDPTFKTEVPKVITRRTRTRSISNLISKESTTKIKKQNKVQYASSRNRAAWKPWENRALLNYLICNRQITFSKGHTVYRKMASDGYLKHRTAESMRIHFRTKILRNIESFDLPKETLKEFKKLKHPSSGLLAQSTQKHRMKKLEKIKKRVKSSAKES